MSPKGATTTEAVYQEVEVPAKEQAARIIHLSEEVFIQGASSSSFTIAEEDNHAFLENAGGDMDANTIERLAGDESLQRPNGLQKKPLYYRLIKRLFDIVFSICVIIVGFIPGLILSAFIAKDTGGSPIYSSVRVGRGGKLFRIYKFRSMVADSDNLENYFTPEQMEQWHREHKVDNDPRITKLGVFLRSSSIDEFPQFINVLLGQISVVGPRAITEEELEYFGSEQALLLSCPPGVTGMWQVGPRNLATFESGLRQKLELTYVDSASIRLDLVIVAKTVRAMIERTGR